MCVKKEKKDDDDDKEERPIDLSSQSTVTCYG